MYEHLRNTFLMELSKRYNLDELNYISKTLDKIALNFVISEKETELAVIEDTVPNLVKIYLASKHLEGCSKTTLNFYLNRLRIFFESVCKSPNETSTNEIRMFLFQYQKQTKVSDRTLDKFRQILNGFFEWCLNEEYITKNPCKNIKEIKYEVEPRTPLTRFQLENIRRSCKSKRELAIIDVLFSTGCRVSELVNMKFDDLNENTIHIIGKGKKHNIVYLNTNAQISLNDYVTKERKGNNDYIFVSERYPHNNISTRTVQKLFEQLSDRLGFEIYPHKIRHTTATLALQNGMSLIEVSKMLGHSSVNTTQIYVDISQEEMLESHKKYVV